MMENKNFLQVEVTDICGPNHFWVVPLKEEKSYMKEVICLHAEMQKKFRDDNLTDNFEDLEDIEYRKDDIVAVRIVERSMVWERARIESLSERGFGEPQYVDVFLIDKGKSIRVKDITSNVRPILNSSWLHIEARAKEFVLLGLTPISKEFDYLDAKMKNVLTSKWCELSQLLIQDMIKLCEEVYISVNTKGDSNGSNIMKKFCGQMFLNMNLDKPTQILKMIERYSEKNVFLKKYFNLLNPEMISVNKLLLKGGFCIDQGPQNITKGEPEKVKHILGDKNRRNRQIEVDLHQKIEILDRKRIENSYMTKKTEPPKVQTSTTCTSSVERLMRWPLDEVNHVEQITSNSTSCHLENNYMADKTEHQKVQTSTTCTSSVERLMRWPLDEVSHEEKITSNSTSCHLKNTSNQSSSFHTAEQGSLNLDNSLVIAGNDPNHSK